MNGSTLSVVPGTTLGLTGRSAGRTVGVIVSGPPSAAMAIDSVSLAELLAGLEGAISVIVFLVESDTPDVPLTGRLVGSLLDDESDAAVAIPRVPAINAAKRVMNGVVVEAVDRTTLNLLRTPEAIDRQALERAMATPAAGSLIRPAELVASGAGSVVVVD